MLKKLRTVQLTYSVFFLAMMPFVATLIGLGIMGCAAQSPATIATSTTNSREDIFVLRSLREERTTKSDWCTPARTGFEPFEPTSGGFLVEDRYSMWAVVVRPGDGRITDAKANRVGELHACFRSTADPKTIGFFAEGRVAGVTFIGNGNCLVLRPDLPEKGITPLRCFLDLRDLPNPYTGGVLTTNTINSKAALGEASDPPGYVQPSIATVRLWHTP